MNNRIDQLLQALNEGIPIEDLLQRYDWQYFEQIVADILEEYGFTVETNKRFSLDRKFEIDVVADNKTEILCIDCKHWGMRQGKTTPLKYAAIDQNERAYAFKSHFKKNQSVYPIVITLMQENIHIEEGIPIVPIFKLNDFLANFPRYKEEFTSH